MQDQFPMFKILIVLAVVAYQGIQVMRKKGKKAETDQTPPVERPMVEEPDFRARTSEDDSALERVRALMHAAPVQQPVVSPVSAQPVVTTVQTPMSTAPTLWDPRTTATLPSLRDLVLAQVIFSPPPTRRGGGQARSPLELRR
jgi:hypothetical protein